ncbi:MAG: protein kinase domain-containing protein, partial [Anaerolineales bacterium]
TYLHGRIPPVVHRDIKPANIKLAASGEAMLVDFGIAKASEAGQKTTTSAVALTPGFAPPEQYGLGRTDPRTDQYALAATLYTLLTGQTPPDSMERLLGNVQLTPPEQLRPDVTPPISFALTRALEVKPDERFENIEAFKAALLGQARIASQTLPAEAARPTLVRPTAGAAATAVISPQPPAPPTVPAESPSAPRSPQRPGWLVPAGIGGAVMVVGVFIVGLVLARGMSAGRATETSPPAQTSAVVAGPTLPPQATHTAPPTAAPSTSTEAPPAPTATPIPPTDTPAPTPTVASTQVGGGGRIAFISNRDGQFFQIYIMNPDGSDVQPVTTDARDKWSPDWQLGRLGPLSGTQLAWSPDGTQLMYLAETSPGSGLDLWVVDADGSNPQNITAATRAGQPVGDDFQPAWCADGTIAFGSIRNNVPQLFVMTLDNRIQRNYSTTRSNPIEYNPAWFPDCRRMLLISTQNGFAELWRVFPFPQALASMWAEFPPLTSQSYRVFLSDAQGYNANVRDVAVSPDGRFVAYTRAAPRPEGNNVVVTTVSDSQLTMNIQQATDAHSDSKPRWSLDGRYLVFVSERDGNPEIYRMLAGGQEQVNLSNNGAIDLDPVWQPVTP